MILKTVTPFFGIAATPFVLADSSNAGGGAAFAAFCLIWFCFIIFFAIIPLISLYKIFEKAGQPGWQAIIPLLSGAVLAHLVGREWWWGIIPILNIVPVFELAKAFGKSDGYGIGLVLLSPIFMPMLAFGNAQYVLEKRPPLF
ncbi:MAG: DUF5684 domain-containing protein [Acidimicrobiia bacterium]